MSKVGCQHGAKSFGQTSINQMAFSRYKSVLSADYCCIVLHIIAFHYQDRHDMLTKCHIGPIGCDVILAEFI